MSHGRKTEIHPAWLAQLVCEQFMPWCVVLQVHTKKHQNRFDVPNLERDIRGASCKVLVTTPSHRVPHLTDALLRHKRPRRIVDAHHRRPNVHLLESIGHRILPFPNRRQIPTENVARDAGGKWTSRHGNQSYRTTSIKSKSYRQVGMTAASNFDSGRTLKLHQVVRTYFPGSANTTLESFSQSQSYWWRYCLSRTTITLRVT